jgi:hypothetical protein
MKKKVNRCLLFGSGNWFLSCAWFAQAAESLAGTKALQSCGTC